MTRHGLGESAREPNPQGSSSARQLATPFAKGRRLPAGKSRFFLDLEVQRVEVLSHYRQPRQPIQPMGRPPEDAVLQPFCRPDSPVRQSQDPFGFALVEGFQVQYMQQYPLTSRTCRCDKRICYVNGSSIFIWIEPCTNLVSHSP